MVKHRRTKKGGSKCMCKHKKKVGRRRMKRVGGKRRIKRYRGRGPLDLFTNMLPGSELGGNLNDMAAQAMNFLPMLL